MGRCANWRQEMDGAFTLPKVKGLHKADYVYLSRVEANVNSGGTHKDATADAAANLADHYGEKPSFTTRIKDLDKSKLLRLRTY